MPKAPENLAIFQSLVDVVQHLRGPEGCPWDKEQNHQTLTQYTLEEAFELAEAIDSGVDEEMQEELGDLLLQVVLHSEIARQRESFDIFKVIEGICSKMIRRHPHVFADVKVADSDEVLTNWQDIKAAEKAAKGKRSKDFNPFEVPLNLPALVRSQKIGSKTKKQNFDWQTPDEVFAKVEEELGELKEALFDGGEARTENPENSEAQKELGDLLFSIVQLARHLNFDAEQALRQTNRRFEQRYQKMKEFCDADGLEFKDLDDLSKEAYWQQAKKELN